MGDYYGAYGAVGPLPMRTNEKTASLPPRCGSRSQRCDRRKVGDGLITNGSTDTAIARFAGRDDATLKAMEIVSLRLEASWVRNKPGLSVYRCPYSRNCNNAYGENA